MYVSDNLLLPYKYVLLNGQNDKQKPQEQRGDFDAHEHTLIALNVEAPV